MKQLNTTQFDSFKAQLLATKTNFKIKSTTYTKLLIVGKQKFMFADEPTSPEQLKLINLTRQDGLNFLKSKQIEPKQSKEIEFFKFVDNFETDQEKVKGYKIDLTSAYWVEAMNQGIVTKETHKYFLECNLNKHARLKALGSFATKKHIQEYSNGKLIKEDIIVYNERLRELYMYICDKVSQVMQIVASSFNRDVFYFYWDCLFFRQSVDVDKVVKLIKKLGFECSIETSDFAILKGKYLSKLIDINKKIDYPIKQRDIIKV